MHDHPYFSEYSQVSTSTLFGTPSVLPFADPLPNLPMMVTTRLRLELLLQHSLLDLRAVSEVILSDAGATLQILRLIGEEYPDEEGRPTRIEDCIVSLNVERWYDVLCASGMSHDASLVDCHYGSHQRAELRVAAACDLWKYHQSAPIPRGPSVVGEGDTKLAADFAGGYRFSNGSRES